MPTLVAIIIFAYFAALILLIIAGLFLLFKYDTVVIFPTNIVFQLGDQFEDNENLLVEENEKTLSDND